MVQTMEQLIQISSELVLVRWLSLWFVLVICREEGARETAKDPGYRQTESPVSKRKSRGR